MLVLSRKRGESIKIGDTTVTVVRTGTNVRLAIDAPREVKILRSELLEGKR